MAKIVLGPIVSDIRGGLGEEVFTKTKGSNIVKKKGKPKKSKSKAKKRTTNAFKDLSVPWNKLRSVTKRQWNSLLMRDNVRWLFRESKIMMGINLYYSVNRNLQEIDEEIINEVPVFKEAQFIKSADAKIIKTGRKRDIKLYIGNGINEENKVVVYATKPITKDSDLSNYRKYRKIKVLDSSFRQGKSVMKEYQQVLKVTPEEGDMIGIRLRAVNIECGVRSHIYQIISTAE
jgi:hypothetical protein